jgi:sec-independent protein translocase protein TatC
MSVTGVIDLFRGKPRNPVGDGGRMSLGDHFRELRARVLRVTVYLLVGTIVALFFWPQLFDLLLHPYNQAREMLDKGVVSKPVIIGAGAPLVLQLKLCGVAAVVATSPLWLYEIWGFIMPGLHPHERRWTRTFVAVAGPLFLLGVAVGYYVLPKGLQVLIGFTPSSVTNLVEVTDFFGFFVRMLLVFGIAFEIPLFVILLNLTGIVSGDALRRHRPWIIVGVFVFAAVATPSTDPFSMLMLAIPMTILFMVSEVIARTVDRRRRKQDVSSTWDDDQASPL